MKVERGPACEACSEPALAAPRSASRWQARRVWLALAGLAWTIAELGARSSASAMHTAAYRYSASEMRMALADGVLCFGCLLVLAAAVQHAAGRPPGRELLRAAATLGLRLCLRNAVLVLGLLPLWLALAQPGIPQAARASAGIAGLIGMGLWLRLGQWAWAGRPSRSARRGLEEPPGTGGRSAGLTALALAIESIPLVAWPLLSAGSPRAWILLWPAGFASGEPAAWLRPMPALPALMAAWLLLLAASRAAASKPVEGEARLRPAVPRSP